MIKLKAMSAAHQVSKNISTTETTAPNKPVQGLKYRNDGLHPEMRKINVQETEKYIIDLDSTGFEKQVQCKHYLLLFTYSFIHSFYVSLYIYYLCKY